MAERIIPAQDREQAIASFARLVEHFLPGRELVVTVDEVKEERSEKQRRSLFGVAYKSLMEQMGLRGESDKQELHEVFCGGYWGWKEVGMVRRPVRTTTKDENGKRDVLSVRQQMAFYSFIQQRAAEYGYDCPDPDPGWFRRAEREEELERQAERAA